MAKKLLGCVIASVLLASCESVEYKQEYAQCAAHWSDVIPVELKNQLVTEYRMEKEFSGKSICTQKNNQTICEHEYDYVQIPYTVVKKVDINAPERNEQIKACVQNACSTKYNNASCKASK